MPNKIDLTGARFGRLVVLHQDGGDRSGARWKCLCDCGTELTTSSRGMRDGSAKSCGCWHRELLRLRQTKHGGSRTKGYSVWVSMLYRCHNPKSQGYADYGGRGIEVCQRWRDDFLAFYSDMGEPPEGMTLERERNNEGYNPSNCKWATPHEQAQNRRTTKLYTIGGQTKSVSEWARAYGLPIGTVHTRLYRGSSIHKALGLTEKLK